MEPGRRQNGNELTADGGVAGALIFLFFATVSHNVVSISVAWSSSPSAKLSIFFRTQARVFSIVESSISMYARC